MFSGLFRGNLRDQPRPDSREVVALLEKHQSSPFNAVNPGPRKRRAGLGPCRAVPLLLQR